MGLEEGLGRHGDEGDVEATDEEPRRTACADDPRPLTAQGWPTWAINPLFPDLTAAEFHRKRLDESPPKMDVWG
jgi:hypothetical protein